MATVLSSGVTTDSMQSLVRFTPMTTTNADGAGIETRWFNNVGIQAVGTFGSGGKVKLQGSLDGTNWCDLADAGDTVIELAAATSYATIRDIPRFVRPYVSAGDGTTSLTVYLWFSGPVR